MTHIENVALQGGSPVSLTITMSVEQAALIAKWVGRFSPKTAGANYPHTSELWDCLAGEFFNRFYEAGVDEAARVLNLAAVAE